MSLIQSTPPLTPEEIAQAQSKLQAVLAALGEVILGQAELLEAALVGVLAGGHVLLEGLPGLGKTELVRGLGQLINLDVGRVQFTPDLLPGDITGNPILEEGEDGRRRFVFQPGPVFCNLLLADEINRASPKTQSALLEAMQERTVTVLGTTHPLSDPFFVLATQNPIELEGTYPLPEAQLDRFMFKLNVSPPSEAVLAEIIQLRSKPALPPAPQLTKEGFLALKQTAARVHLPELVARYIARLVSATHPGASQAARLVRHGASPRAAIALAASGRARALIHGRVHVDFADIEALAPAVLGHRLVLDYSARLEEASAADVVAALLAEVSPHDGALPPTLQEPA